MNIEKFLLTAFLTLISFDAHSVYESKPFFSYFHDLVKARTLFDVGLQIASIETIDKNKPKIIGLLSFIRALMSIDKAYAAGSKLKKYPEYAISAENSGLLNLATFAGGILGIIQNARILNNLRTKKFITSSDSKNKGLNRKKILIYTWFISNIVLPRSIDYVTNEFLGRFKTTNASSNYTDLAKFLALCQEQVMYKFLIKRMNKVRQ